jgi:hypothetical protein
MTEDTEDDYDHCDHCGENYPHGDLHFCRDDDEECLVDDGDHDEEEDVK